MSEPRRDRRVFGTAFMHERPDSAAPEPFSLAELIRRILQRPPKDPEERRRLREQIRFVMENLRARF
jgi:hypothetical protein